MTSERQIEANRQNAQFSTGPTSAAGKAAVARNAVKFNFTGQQVLLPGEDSQRLFRLEDYRRAATREFDKALRNLRELNKDTQREEVDRLRTENQTLARNCKEVQDDYERVVWGGELSTLDPIRILEIFGTKTNPIPGGASDEEEESRAPQDS